MCSEGDYKIEIYFISNNGRREKRIKPSEQKLNIQEVLRPQLIEGIMTIMYSFNLIPKDVLDVSSYNNRSELPSIISMHR